jgi:cAMP-dependent protein kinase regulator
MTSNPFQSSPHQQPSNNSITTAPAPNNTNINNDHLQEDLESYLVEKGVHALFLRMVEALLVDRPDDVPEFLLYFLLDKFPQLAQNVKSSLNNNNNNNNNLPPPPNSTNTTTTTTTTMNNKSNTKPSSTKQQRQTLLPPPSETLSEGDSMLSADDVVDDSLRPISPLQSKQSQQQQSVITEGRRGSISAAPITAEEAALPPVVYPKSNEDKIAITAMLQNNWLTSSLDDDQTRRIVDAMKLVEFQPGEIIIKQGDEHGDAYYLVKSGVAHVIQEPFNGTILRICEVGDGFGELALLYNTPRCASVVAAAAAASTATTSLWSLDRITFKKTLISSVMARRERHREFLSKIKLFKPLSEKERLVVADALQITNYNKGSTIIKQGEKGDSFFLLSKGRVQVFHNNELVDTLSGEGAYFGEIALLSSDGLRATTIIAMEDVEVFKLRREVFHRVLGSTVMDRLRKGIPEYKRSLSSSSLSNNVNLSKKVIDDSIHVAISTTNNNNTKSKKKKRSQADKVSTGSVTTNTSSPPSVVGGANTNSGEATISE